MPTNLYGPGDNFDLLSSHVLPALIRKFHLAKLACQGDWDGIQHDEALFGPIPDDLRRSLGLPAALDENSLPQAEPVSIAAPLNRNGKNSSSPCPLRTRATEGSGREKRGQNSVLIWGTGSPRREFLHVDDLASACLFIMDKYEDLDHINVGTGQDQTIGELAELVRDIVYPEANLVFDHSKPDGTPQKLLDNRKLRDLGWISKIDFTNGIKNTYAWYLTQTQ
jgi:GDP-L-fucose synthase